jgi:uncharacterized membrane protein
MVKLKCLVLGAAVCAAAMLITTDFSDARRGGGGGAVSASGRAVALRGSRSRALG